MVIERITNGYMLVDDIGQKHAFPSIQELFEHILLVLEGKGEHFGGSMYGKVRLEFKESK